MNPPLLFIRPTSAAKGAFFDLPAFRANARMVRVYDLDAGCMDGVRAVLVPAHVDQRALQHHRPYFEALLARGGTLVFNGHVAYPCLPELRPFVPLPQRGLAELQVRTAMPHPVFAGVDANHLSLRRGVAGFYGRGHNPPPPGAQVLNTIGPDDAPLDWLHALPGGGRLLMHGGNDLWMYAGDDSTAARVAPQLLDWLLSGEPR